MLLYCIGQNDQNTVGCCILSYYSYVRSVRDYFWYLSVLISMRLFADLRMWFHSCRFARPQSPYDAIRTLEKPYVHLMMYTFGRLTSSSKQEEPVQILMSYSSQNWAVGWMEKSLQAALHHSKKHSAGNKSLPDASCKISSVCRSGAERARRGNHSCPSWRHG